MHEIKKNLLKNFNIVKINSNEIKSGDIFIALKGKKTHGNQYIFEAIKKGAKYIVTDKKPEGKNLNKNIILVKDTLKFLLNVAIHKRNLYNGKVIGITGSAGKTSVKENLKFLLSSHYKVSASIKSYNNFLGVIISLLNLDINSDFAIFEMGTSNFSEIKKLTQIIMPSQIIITNIFPTHLEKLISTRNIAIEKSDIFNFDYNPNVELAILSNNNIDEEFIINKAKKNNNIKIITFGNNKNSDLKIKKIIKDKKHYFRIFLQYRNEIKEFLVNKNQIQKLSNILICFIFFIFNKIKLDIFIALVKDLPLIEGRGLHNTISINNKKINIIDESYNASPITMKNSIDYLINYKIKENQKKFLILGDMCELGNNALMFHIDILKYIKKKNLDNVIICGELMKIALEKNNNSKILFMPNIKLIMEYLKKFLNSNDIILIKGSNSSLTNKLTKELLKKGVC